MAAAFPELRDVTVSLKQYISFTLWDDIGRFLRLLTQARSSQLKNSSLGGDDICFFWASETGRIVYVSFYIFCIN